jgi:exosome complex component RRP41
MHGHQPAVSPEGLRHDGRRPLEHRKMVCRIGGFAGDGSALFTLGNTHVAASVFGPREQRGSRAERAAVVVEVHVAAFASQERKAPSRKDKRSVETAVLVRQAFEAVVETERFPRSEIRIVLNVLGADGGMRVACLNAASLALAHAGVPMRDLVAACAVGRVGETMLMDPTLKEDAAGAVLPVAILPSSGRIVMCQMDSKLPQSDFAPLLSLALEGAMHVSQVLRAALTAHMAVLVDAAAAPAAAAAQPIEL